MSHSDYDSWNLGITRRYSEASGLQVIYRAEFAASLDIHDGSPRFKHTCSVDTALYAIYWMRKRMQVVLSSVSDTTSPLVKEWLDDIDTICRSVRELSLRETYQVSISDTNGCIYTASITPVLSLPLIGVHEIREDGHSWFE